MNYITKNNKLMDINKLQNLNPKKILICQQRQLGDVILATAVFEALHKKFPLAKIDVFTEKKCVCLLENNPYLHKIYGLDKELPFLKQLRLYYSLHKEKYDLVIDFQQLPRCRFVMLFTRNALRYTFTPRRIFKFLYSDWQDIERGHSSITKINLLQPFGISWNNEKPLIALTSEEKKASRELLESFGFNHNINRLITVDTTHHDQSRCWDGDKFAKICDAIFIKNPEIFFFFIYGPNERGRVETVLDKLSPATRKNTIVLPDIVGLRLIAGIIGQAILHFGNCSSPRHIAVAMDVPSFTVIGAAGIPWLFPSHKHKHIFCTKNGKISTSSCWDMENVGDINEISDVDVLGILEFFLERQYGK